MLAFCVYLKCLLKESISIFMHICNTVLDYLYLYCFILEKEVFYYIT